MALKKLGKEEASDDITIYLDNHSYAHGIYDAVVPVFCFVCKITQDNFYLHTGSRYGDVGGYRCENCNELYRVTDNDNLLGNLYFHYDGQRHTLDLDALYKINEFSFLQIKKYHGLDLAELLKNDLDKNVITLKLLMDTYFQDLEPQYEHEDYIFNNTVVTLPPIVKKWHSYFPAI